MVACWQATISGFNEFKGDQARVASDALFSLTTFNTEVTVEEKVRPIGEIPDRDTENYTPNGGTALYDAVARTIASVSDKINEMGAKPEKHLFVIMTDGEENSSKEYRRDEVFRLIKEKEQEGWEFVYLGANHDAYAAGASIGVPQGNTSPYIATPAGTRSAFAGTSLSAMNYAQSADYQSGNFFQNNSFVPPSDPTVSPKSYSTPKVKTPKKKAEKKPVGELFDKGL